MENSNEHFMQNISDDVWLYIFDLLDSSSLQNVSKVCKRFFNIILQSKTLQSNLQLKVDSQNITEMAHEVHRLPYKNIIINSKPLPGLNFSETISPLEFNIFAEYIVCRRKNEIEKLKIIGFCGNFLEEFLQFFQNLTELYLFEAKLELSNRYSINERVGLPNLKILELRKSNYILDILKAENLNKLIIHDCSDFNENFLKCSTKLESLVIYNFEIDYFKFSGVLNLKLKALKLIFESSDWVILCSIGYRETPIKAALQNFILTQKDHLNELSISLGTESYRSSRKSVTFVEFCLKELKNLTKFSIKSTENQRFDNNFANKSVKEYEIHGSFDIITLMSVCPSTKSLTLNIDEYLNVNILEQISEFMPNLKILHVSTKSIKREILTNTNFENLEMLKITELNSDSDFYWPQIALDCPNLKELSLNYENMQILPQKLENVLEKCEKLEILSFNADFKFLAFLGFFEAFVLKPANLRRINFSAREFNDHFYEGVEYLTRETNIKIYIKEK